MLKYNSNKHAMVKRSLSTIECERKFGRQVREGAFCPGSTKVTLAKSTKRGQIFVDYLRAKCSALTIDIQRFFKNVCVPSTTKRVSSESTQIKIEKTEGASSCDYYARKQFLLKKSVKSLVLKNAALCDEVSRLNQRIQTVADERKILLKRLLNFEKAKEKRRSASTIKKATKSSFKHILNSEEMMNRMVNIFYLARNTGRTDLNAIKSEK
uniref:Uncharacterized protein n=1 Tax=Romanomermis culicivorax TaxID=13658 RepID=A0A915JC79_ROMCU